MLAFVKNTLKQAGKVCVGIFTRLPLIGRLQHVRAEARLQALFETLTTTIFATMPFWILPLLGWFIFSPRPAFDEALRRGEGLVYASVLLGPLVYVLTKRYGRFSMHPMNGSRFKNPLSLSFPYGGAFVVITAVTCAISGFAFAVLRNDSGAALDYAGIQTFSWILMIGATVVFYLVTSYRNMLDDLEKNRPEVLVGEQPKQEASFVDEWMRAKQ